MSESDRAGNYANEIGSLILDELDEWVEMTLDGREGMGTDLIREIMIFSDSELAYRLGMHYMPENSDAEDFLSDDDESEDDE